MKDGTAELCDQVLMRAKLFPELDGRQELTKFDVAIGAIFYLWHCFAIECQFLVLADDGVAGQTDDAL